MILLASMALADPASEHERLGEELRRLAQRNTWSGVDRTYRDLVALRIPLPPSEHLLGAQAALASGETLLAYWRLRRAEEPPADAAPSELEAVATAGGDRRAIETRYGLVSLSVGEGAVPVLYRDDMPFAPQERDAIVAAQKHVSATRAFRGLLPAGTYRLDDASFTVLPGPAWNVVVAGSP